MHSYCLKKREISNLHKRYKKCLPEYEFYHVKFGAIIAPKMQEVVKSSLSQKYSEHDMKKYSQSMGVVLSRQTPTTINFHITYKSKSELFHLFVKNWYVFIRQKQFAFITNPERFLRYSENGPLLRDRECSSRWLKSLFPTMKSKADLPLIHMVRTGNANLIKPFFKSHWLKVSAYEPPSNL